MYSPSTLFCGPGEYNCSATTCAVLESFTGPDTLFTLLKHLHSALNILYINETYIRMISLANFQYHCLSRQSLLQLTSNESSFLQNAIYIYIYIYI